MSSAITLRPDCFKLSSKIEAQPLTSISDIENCSESLERLGAIGDPPLFFLSTLSSDWIPRMMMIKEGDRLLGLVYAKERKVFGLRSGLIYADSILNSAVFARPEHVETVFHAGITTILKSAGVKGVRTLTPPSDYADDVLIRIADELDLDKSFGKTEHHAVIDLPSTYAGFLASLRHNSRHNFKRSRSRSLAAGHQFCADISFEEFQRAVRELQRQGVRGSHPEKLDLALRVFRAAQKPLLMGIMSAEDNWISLLGGWQDRHRTVINMQMNNDKDYPKYSLSLVIRSYAIETLINRQCKEMIFIATVSEPLSHYARPITMSRAYLDKRDRLWRLFRQIVKRHQSMLRGWASWMSEWIVDPKKD